MVSFQKQVVVPAALVQVVVLDRLSVWTVKLSGSLDAPNINRKTTHTNVNFFMTSSDKSCGAQFDRRIHSAKTILIF